MKKIILKITILVLLIVILFQIPWSNFQKTSTLHQDGQKYLGEKKGVRWIDTQVDAMGLRDKPIVKQDAYSTHFLLPDGKVQALFSAFKQNFEVFPGNWEPIDYSLEKSDDPNYEFKTKNGVGIYLSKNGGIFQKDKEHQIGPPQMGWYDVERDTFTPLDNLDTPEVKTEENRLTLQGDDVHLIVYAYDIGAREDLIIENKDVLKGGRPWEELVLKAEISAEDNIQVNGILPKETQELIEKDILVIDSEKGKVIIPFPAAWDSKDEIGPIRRFLKKEGGKWNLYTTVAYSWLNDDSRVYPVTIDPTYSNTAPTDVVIRNDGPNSNYGGTAYLYLGHSGSGYPYTYRSLIKFDFSSIPASSPVSSASLSLWRYDGGTTNTTANVYRQKRAWVEGQATWNAYATGSSWQTAGGFGTNDAEQTTIASATVSTTNGEKQWTNFDATLLKDMWDGGWTNNGFLIKASSESNNWHYFRSSEYATAGERPKMVIVYVVPPTAPTIGTPTALSTTSIRWTFTDNASDETGFKVYNTSNVLVATCAAANLTYCNETGLSVNTQYTRKVVAYNSAGNSSYSSTATIYTLANVPGTPTVSSSGTTTANVIVAINLNPASTEFAIQETGSTNYVNKTTGALQASASWGIYAEFGSGSGITVTSLLTNTQYTFKVEARNGNNVLTSFSATDMVYTRAATPPAPSIDKRATSTIQPVTINGGTNPAGTQVSLYKEIGSTCDGSGGSYIAADGSDNGSTAVWQTAITWGTKTVTGLSQDQQYSFCTRARNGDNVNTSFGVSASYNSCVPSLAGDHTITNDCSFPATTDGNNGARKIHGVDSGTGATNSAKLIVESGVVTVNSDETLIAGSFEVMGTGSIAVANGGELKPGLPLWVVDQDVDGFPAAANTLYAQTNAPTNGRRRNLISRLSVVDCDDTIYQPYGCLRKPVTLTYSGTTLTNHDVVLTVDTSALIAAGKMQSDCGDIKIRDSNGTTNLTYWIEGGCNTTTTQIWARVPSIPDGGKTIYLDYDGSNIANGFSSWAGTFTLMYNASCPADWTRNTNFDNKFPRGAATYGGTGGSTTSSHTNTSISSGVADAYKNGAQGAGVTTSGNSHTHDATFSFTNAISVLPPYLDMVYCNKADLTTIPSGMIAIHASTPPSGWTQFSSLNTTFPRGSATYGGTGGATTHSHSFTSATSGTAQTNMTREEEATSNTSVPASHTHTGGSGTSGTASNLPAYKDVIFGSANSDTTPFAGIISMVTAAPPLGWTRLSAYDSLFLRGNSTSGGTGGSNNHTHSASIGSGNSSTTVNNIKNAGSGAPGTPHAHTFSGNTSASNSWVPPYVDTVVVQRNTPSATTSAPGTEIYRIN